jgi:hypothetical protein
LFYGRLRIINANTAPTTIMAIITPTIAGTKYKSAADGAGVAAAGAAVTAFMNATGVCAVLRKYELEPSNVAMIV